MTYLMPTLTKKNVPNGPYPADVFRNCTLQYLVYFCFALALFQHFGLIQLQDCWQQELLLGHWYTILLPSITAFGPLVMGSCRGGNLLLGAAIIPASLSYLWPLAFLPVVYIASITLISRGEVHGGSKRTGILATSFVGLVTSVLLLLSFLDVYTLVTALPFAILFWVMVLPAFVSAASDPISGKIMTAVKRGVISLIILNSALAAGFAGLIPGLIVLALLPLSFLSSKVFAVT